MVAIMRSRLLCLFLLLLMGSQPSSECSAIAKPQADVKFTDPKSTFRNYIEAIRKNDLKAAIQCWAVDDDNRSGALDVVVGLWVSMRQINQVTAHQFGHHGLEKILKGWHRDDVSDQALDLTMKRLETAEVKINGDQAELTIRWNEGDGYPKAAFMYGKEPLLFSNILGNWKLDANRMTGLKTGADFFAKGTWGPMFRDQIVIMNEVVAHIQRGTLTTRRDLALLIEEKTSALTKRPFVKGQLPGDIIFIEDTKDRYVELRVGEHGVGQSGGLLPENRPDLKQMHDLNDDLDRICRIIHGQNNPRIVIETKNKGYYQVVYKWGDREALKVIARPLGLVVIEEDREVPVITIRESAGGHKLKQSAKITKTKMEEICCDVEGRWPLEGVTVNDLARFLESHYSRPVVNKTTLQGQWSILLSSEAEKIRLREGEIAQLDNLGLVLQMEKAKIRVTVVKDKY
jgi:Protein of unknown function (DUF3738)